MTKLKYPMSKSEPKIEKIKKTKKQRDELKAELKKTMTTEGINRIIKKYAGGVCSTCGNIPTKNILFDADGAQVIERYCDKCFKRRGL